MNKEIKRLRERVANSESHIATSKALIESMETKLALAKDILVCEEADREIYNDALMIATHEFLWVRI